MNRKQNTQFQMIADFGGDAAQGLSVANFVVGGFSRCVAGLVLAGVGDDGYEVG